jgi:Spy/CpxP family protein refolding chaperone
MKTKLQGLFVLAALGASTLGVSVPVLVSARADSTRTNTDKKHSGPRRGQMMERMAKELELTKSQKSQIQKIIEESRARGRKIHDDKSLSETKKRQEMRKNREATHVRVSAILTPDQRKKWDAKRKEMRERHRENKGRPHKPERTT